MIEKAKLKSACERSGCDNEFEYVAGQVRFYCSKKCRLLSRGGKRGRRVAKRYEPEVGE